MECTSLSFFVRTVYKKAAGGRPFLHTIICRKGAVASVPYLRSLNIFQLFKILHQYIGTILNP